VLEMSNTPINDKEVSFLLVACDNLSASLDASGFKTVRRDPSESKKPRYKATFVAKAPRRSEKQEAPEPKPELSIKLIEAYLATEYVIKLDDSEVVMRVDEPPYRLTDLLAEYGVETAAFLTAANPESEFFADKWNKKLNGHLIKDIEVNNYQYLKGEGRDPAGLWKPEESVMVFGISKSEANRFASKYSQNAFVFAEKGKAPELVLV